MPRITKLDDLKARLVEAEKALRTFTDDVALQAEIARLTAVYKTAEREVDDARALYGRTHMRRAMELHLSPGPGEHEFHPELIADVERLVSWTWSRRHDLLSSNVAQHRVDPMTELARNLAGKILSLDPEYAAVGRVVDAKASVSRTARTALSAVADGQKQAEYTRDRVRREVEEEEGIVTKRRDAAETKKAPSEDVKALQAARKAVSDALEMLKSPEKVSAWQAGRKS
jgi:hypothetical protein